MIMHRINFVELEEDPALMPPSVPYLKSLNV
jgi:hypothetical protein